ncbi:B12-binding domain-containing radical SAM protein [candidate division CSSED10-310 bacterium]|uniref:B12-binding domain-containing radical SAM protein n=1 Tax=candidate division CSSED10-310 bacterium TaxID=2855610 RepID=A0ABV6YYM2_UNCC1
MRKRVLLVYPHYVTGWLAQPRLAIPLSVLCVATPVSRAGYEVKIIDQRTEPDWRSILINELSHEPICVGISTMTGPQLKYALEISSLVKKYGHSPVVWGGIHPSLLPEQTLQNENIDFVVQGEGENTFLELVQALEGQKPLSSVKGIWYRENGEIRKTGLPTFVDLNQQPPIAYDLIDLKKYSRVLFGLNHHNFFTSRGCPRQCTFCYNTVINRKKWRAMDPEIAVNRIKDFVKKYKVQGLIINESNFFLDLDRARSILKGFIKENLNIAISKVNIDFSTLFEIQPDDLILLEKAGCRRIPVAIESGSHKIRTLLNKPIDIQLLLEVNRLLNNTKIVPNYLFMMGFPTETRDDLSESIALAFKLIAENQRAGIYFNIYTPYPGTELFNTAVKHGLKIPQSIEEWIPFHYRHLSQNGPWLTAEMRKIVRMLDFCSFFIGQRPLLHPTEKTSAIATLIGRLYAPIARLRVRKLWYHFPIEVTAARFFRIYGKQY